MAVDFGPVYTALYYTCIGMVFFFSGLTNCYTASHLTAALPKSPEAWSVRAVIHVIWMQSCIIQYVYYTTKPFRARVMLYARAHRPRPEFNYAAKRFWDRADTAPVWLGPLAVGDSKGRAATRKIIMIIPVLNRRTVDVILLRQVNSPGTGYLLKDKKMQAISGGTQRIRGKSFSVSRNQRDRSAFVSTDTTRHSAARVQHRFSIWFRKIAQKSGLKKLKI